MRPPGEVAVALLRPADYSATFEPLRIYDGSGDEVASEGNRVTVGGDRIRTPSDTCRTASWIQVLDIRPGKIDLAP
jgi:hypothetical protein